MQYFLTDRVSWLEVEGPHYARGGVVVISMNFMIPVFALIIDILVQDVDEFCLQRVRNHLLCTTLSLM